MERYATLIVPDASSDVNANTAASSAATYADASAATAATHADANAATTATYADANAITASHPDLRREERCRRR